MRQIKLDKLENFKNKFLRLFFIISTCRICKAIVRKGLILRVENVLQHPVKLKSANLFYYSGTSAPLTLHFIYHIVRVIQQ